MSIEGATKRAKSLKYDSVKEIAPYKGKKIYMCIKDSKGEECCIGYPVFLLEENEMTYIPTKIDDTLAIMIRGI